MKTKASSTEKKLRSMGESLGFVSGVFFALFFASLINAVVAVFFDGNAPSALALAPAVGSLLAVVAYVRLYKEVEAVLAILEMQDHGE